ncbi:MAG: MarR family transcriptional regulator [Comamonas sp.]|nr:MarR family transcriptional regulator [Comamonas sp.]
MHKTIPAIPPAAYADPKRLLGVRLVGLGRRWRKTLDTQLATNGLSDAAWTPLMHLLRLGDGLSQTELAAAIGLEGSSLVRLLDMLVAQGLIERQAHASDRRIKLIYLTPQGRQTATEVRQRLTAIEDALLVDLEPQAAQWMLQAFDRIEARIAAAQPKG